VQHFEVAECIMLTQLKAWSLSVDIFNIIVDVVEEGERLPLTRWFAAI